MGVWDALGQGIQGGVDAYFRGKGLQQDEAQRKAYEDLQRQQLALDQFRSRQSMEQWEQQQATEGQLRAEKRHEALDPRSDPSRDIYIPMFATLADGVYVPISQEERDRMYAEQLTTWEDKQRQLRAEGFGQEKELTRLRAQLQSGVEGQGQPSFFFPTGEVNTLEAWNFLQNWMKLKGGNPITDPQFLELFLNDIVLQYGNTVPNAREKAQMWLSQAMSTATEPKQEGGLIPTLQKIPFLGAQPYPLGFGSPKGWAPLIEKGVEKGKEVVGNIADLFRGVASAQETIPSHAQGAQTISAGGMMAPPVPAPQRTLRDFEAEVLAEQPHLKAWPAAITTIATNRYQEYLKGLRK